MAISGVATVARGGGYRPVGGAGDGCGGAAGGGANWWRIGDLGHKLLPFVHRRDLGSRARIVALCVPSVLANVVRTVWSGASDGGGMGGGGLGTGEGQTGSGDLGEGPMGLGMGEGRWVWGWGRGWPAPACGGGGRCRRVGVRDER
ncbi:uncharacterized protein LOC130998584 [Salvia miltiorrhiza]|uniref:uncharacterized protein LOC130998584 n=1 Tax=Salvia miltiorrhiza TaxID=226208 RepID=UPI0025ABF5EC|nr:uncharacterized protein LOC130998584 [Salvia miltiorrhiza]